MASWDRQTREPAKAYHHFTIYRDLGPERSLAKAGQVSGVSVARCEQLSELYGWVERCDQWDAHVRAVHDRAFLTETAKQGQKRGRAYARLLEKALEALDEVDVSRVPLSHIAAAMKTASEGMRLEEGLATASVTMEVQDARVVLSRLPAEVRSPLLRALAADAASRGSAGAAGGVPLGLDGD